MPIIFSKELPATANLIQKGVFIMDPQQADRQDIRPLEIGILNIMPKKEDTESQLLRMIGDGPLQIKPTFVSLESCQSKNTASSHLEKFYTPFSEAKKKAYDGFIVTGANVERLPYEEVKYWEELKEIFEWIEQWVTSTLFICWGAQAALHQYYGIKKYPLDKKLFGVFPHAHLHDSELLRGIDDVFSIPVSRHTEVKKEDITEKGIDVLVESKESGVAIAANKDRSQIFSFGHLEYDRTTIAHEFFRDREAGEEIDIPNEQYKSDSNPIDSNCVCPCCQQFSRAALRHFFKCGEPLGARMLSIHNLWFYQQIVRNAD